MKTLKSTLFLMVMLLCFAGFATSCSDDDDEPQIDNVISDYYVTIELTDKGQMRPADANAFEVSLNSSISGVVYYRVDERAAVHDFKEDMEDLRVGFATIYEDFSPAWGTIVMKFALVREDGKTVTTISLKMDKDGCYYV